MLAMALAMAAPFPQSTASSARQVNTDRSGQISATPAPLATMETTLPPYALPALWDVSSAPLPASAPNVLRYQGSTTTSTPLPASRSVRLAHWGLLTVAATSSALPALGPVRLVLE